MMISFKKGDVHKFYYSNYKGERAIRTGMFVQLEHFNEGEIEYYPLGAWCARYFDIEKQADRSFNLDYIEIDTLIIL